MGVNKTLLINPKSDTESLAQEVIELLGDSPNITLECSGAESSLNLAIYVTKDGGNVIMVGLNHNKVTVALSSAACREVNLLGIKRYRHRFVITQCLVNLIHFIFNPIFKYKVFKSQPKTSLNLISILLIITLET
jgi:L-iditol 2-dehydrogenase